MRKVKTFFSIRTTFALLLLACCTFAYAFEGIETQGYLSVTTSMPNGVQVNEERCERHTSGSRRDELVVAALKEQSAFQALQTEEFDEDKTAKRIAAYWAAVPRDDPATAAVVSKIIEEWQTDPKRALAEHWSAAFTSWLMCKAGFSAQEFKRSLGHRFYIDHALNEPMAAHQVMDAATTLPRPGDIVCADAASQPSTHTLAEYRRNKPKLLHCHLVTFVGADTIQVVGGNVEGKVRLTEIQASRESGASGLPWSDDRRKGWAWFAVLGLKPGRD